MTAPSITNNVVELVNRAEQLAPRDFEAFLANILSINAKRKARGLSVEESQLLKNINQPFSPAKMKRFLALDEKRRQETLSSEEHRELLRLVRQLEKFDAQRLQWLGQLAILRNTSLHELMVQLGLYSKTDD